DICVRKDAFQRGEVVAGARSDDIEHRQHAAAAGVGKDGCGLVGGEFVHQEKAAQVKQPGVLDLLARKVLAAEDVVGPLVVDEPAVLAFDVDNERLAGRHAGNGGQTGKVDAVPPQVLGGKSAKRIVTDAGTDCVRNPHLAQVDGHIPC